MTEIGHSGEKSGKAPEYVFIPFRDLLQCAPKNHSIFTIYFGRMQDVRTVLEIVSIGSNFLKTQTIIACNETPLKGRHSTAECQINVGVPNKRGVGKSEI